MSGLPATERNTARAATTLRLWWTVCACVALCVPGTGTANAQRIEDSLPVSGAAFAPHSVPPEPRSISGSTWARAYTAGVATVMLGSGLGALAGFAHWEPSDPGGSAGDNPASRTGWQLNPITTGAVLGSAAATPLAALTITLTAYRKQLKSPYARSLLGSLEGMLLSVASTATIAKTVGAPKRDLTLGIVAPSLTALLAPAFAVRRARRSPHGPERKLRIGYSLKRRGGRLRVKLRF